MRSTLKQLHDKCSAFAEMAAQCYARNFLLVMYILSRTVSELSHSTCQIFAFECGIVIVPLPTFSYLFLRTLLLLKTKFLGATFLLQRVWNLTAIILM